MSLSIGFNAMSAVSIAGSATWHDAHEPDAGEPMQETQMSFNLQYAHHGPDAGYKTPAAEAWGNVCDHRTDQASAGSAAACVTGAAFIVRWEGPDLDAIVYNGHAGLGS